MDENPKNPYQLTDEDRSIVDRIFISCIVVMDRLMIKYCTPEDYVKKFALSAISSDKKFATGRIIINSNNKYDGPVPPNRINEDLALEAEIFRPTDEDTSALDKFLHPRDMTEVIKILEREGVLEV